MRTKVFRAIAIAGAIFPIAGHAQTTVGVAPAGPGVVVTTPIEIEADGGLIAAQRPAFREYVLRERVPAYTIPERVVVGATLPDDGVTYYDVPQRFGATPYRYTVVNGATVLVEPKTRRIIQVVE